MRNIDFYIGVPLCFLVTCLDFILQIFRSQKLPSPKNILFIELSEMGSAILADPCMRKARSWDCELFFLIFNKNKASLYLLQTVKDENIFVLRERNLFLLLWDSLRFIFWCRQRKIDSCVDLELFSRVTALLTWASFAQNRVGFHRYHQEGLYRGEILTHRVPYNAHTHIAHNFMNLIESLVGGVSSDGFLKQTIEKQDIKMAQAEITKDMRRAVEDKIKKATVGWNSNQGIVLINANAGEFLPQRKWPKEYFMRLIRLLLESRQDIYILLTGAPNESDENNWISTAVGHARCVNFSGCVFFEELPTLYSLAKVLITNDSGPGHFSSVTNIRSFVFFGPETPSLYGSLGNSSAIYSHMSCSPCVSATNHRKTECTDNLCLKVISPESVVKKVIAVL